MDAEYPIDKEAVKDLDSARELDHGNATNFEVSMATNARLDAEVESNSNNNESIESMDGTTSK